jgi:AcrR family transcriptional regulator
VEDPSSLRLDNRPPQEKDEPEMNPEARVTLEDIARAVGVDKSTVSATLRDIPRAARFRPEIRARIQRALENIAPVEFIADSAGVAPATIYVHFGTKDKLVAAVVERLLAEVTDRLSEAYRADGSPFERIKVAERSYRHWLHDHPAASRYITTTGLRPADNVVDTMVGEQLSLLESALESLLQDAVEAGEVREVDCRLAAYFFFAAWNGVAALTHRNDALGLTLDEVDRAMQQGAEILGLGLQR